MSLNSPVPSCPEIAVALASYWGLAGAEVTPLMGGMNSATWNVRMADGRWVAKAVPLGVAEEQFRYGLRLSARVEAAGVRAGAPVALPGGELTASVAGYRLALLRWVEGQELDGHKADDMARMGALLGRVHAVLGTEPVTAEYARAQFVLLGEGQDRAAVGLRPWIGPAVAAVEARLRRLGTETLTWGPLHGDPAPEHFRLDAATGECGLIDWGAASFKPRLYDVATVVMDAGGPDRARPLLRAYGEAGAVASEEIGRALRPLLDFRYAINALYFAGRIARGEVTGVDDPAGNESRLEEARRWLGCGGGGAMRSGRGF